jgi:hypothetical protein
MATPGGTPGKSKRGLLLMVAAVAVLVLLLGGGYVFGLYLPNRPSSIFATSLERSGKAVDALIDYSKTATAQQYKSYKLEGSLKLTASGTTIDATLRGAYDKDANLNTTVDVSVLGKKITADVLSRQAAGSKSPDVYLRLSGIKPALDSYGLSTLDSLDGQWISVDHTLIEGLTSSVTQDMASAANVPTPAQIQDALAKAQAVNKQYLFTTEPQKAVFKQSKYVGKETKDGRAVHHYKGYDKNNLSNYVKALGDALDSSKLNDWAKSNGGKDLSETMDLGTLATDAKNGSGNYTFDAWVDAKTKLFHALRFTDPSDSNTSVTISQNYTGGDVYPLGLNVTTKDGSDVVTEVLSLNLNTKTNVADGTVTMKATDLDGTIKFTLTPSNESVQVTAPTSVKPLTDVLNQLGLGGYL